ncbi:hypothetical protein FN846DRAFT_986963 [Sphaerosporella brunnea]|uniref:EKC/KEOPS complex subunit BUD32 n=1 Tax=Sphaerosporella brunnea TaxID=1250544 RepID=A0A5J5ESD6_9PEZI|nr:hypothetical protein FN846DRAFT_986963 [Sphaerosporella brunnea]
MPPSPRFPELRRDTVVTDRFLDNAFTDFLELVQHGKGMSPERLEDKFAQLLAPLVNQLHEQRLKSENAVQMIQLESQNAVQKIQLESQNAVQKVQSESQNAMQNVQSELQQTKLVLAQTDFALRNAEAELRTFWSASLIAKSKTEIWNAAVGNLDPERLSRQLPKPPPLSGRIAKDAKALGRSKTPVAEDQLYEPVCALLRAMVGKAGIVFDTHARPYLNGLKPDISVCASTIDSPHGAYVHIVGELKSRDVPLDADARGQLLNYLHWLLTLQPSRHRFTGWLSNIRDNVFILVERNPRGGRPFVSAYAPVSFEMAVAHLGVIMKAHEEQPLRPEFSSRLGNIHQHLGMSCNSAVASFVLKTEAANTREWNWTTQGIETAKPAMTKGGKSDPVSILRTIANAADKSPHLPMLLFWAADFKEFGMLPVGKPADPLKLNNTPSLAVRILHDVFDGMDWLHKHGLMHRDIRWDNIVVNEQERGVLIDLGSVTATNQPASQYYGGWECVPPRLLKNEAMNKPYTPRVGDDYHAFILLVNTLLFPFSFRGWSSANVGFRGTRENERLQHFWRGLTKSQIWGPFVAAAASGKRDEVRSILQMVMSIDCTGSYWVQDPDEHEDPDGNANDWTQDIRFEHADDPIGLDDEIGDAVHGVAVEQSPEPESIADAGRGIDPHNAASDDGNSDNHSNIDAKKRGINRWHVRLMRALRLRD